MIPSQHRPNAPVPKVSFLALCYNHAPYVLECLDSIEAQAWQNAELVILDNASADDSANLIRHWAKSSALDPKLLLQSEPRGICANLNTLIENATGDLLAWIATDDYWMPEKTRVQVAAFERLGPEVAVTYADALQIDSAGEPIEPASFIQSHRQFGVLPSGDILLELLRGPFIPGMSTMIRRAAMDAIGPFDEALIYEDYDAWLRLAEHWEFHADPTPQCAYRILDSSMIRTVAAQDRPEKVLSDARIMAKVSSFQRLDEVTRKNTRRRVIKLAAQLIQHPGDWERGLLEIQRIAQLESLHVLAAAHRDRGQIIEEESQRLLAAAARDGLLPPDEVSALPKSVASQLRNLSRTAPPPEQRKPWWRFGRS